MKNENKTLKNRRKLLKTVAAGGGAIIAGKTLPEKWGRPVVDSVLLPAHAQTSGGPSTYSGATRASLVPDSLFAKALDTLIPQSHAASALVFDVTWCITPVSATTADVSFLMVEQNIQFADLWSASGVQVGVTTPLTYSNGCATFANAGNWLNRMGLINDAQASLAVQVTLNGLNPGDTFRFENFNYAKDFTEQLANGACGPDSVENCRGVG